MDSSRVGDGDDVVRHLGRTEHGAHRRDGRRELGGIRQRFERVERRLAAGAEEEFAFGPGVGRADFGDDGEAVELAFHEWERSRRLKWVLRRDEEKGFRERTGHAVDGDLAFLHCFEERRLCAWRGAVQLVDEYDVGKEWTGTELPLVAGEVEDRDAGQFAR